MKILGIETSCDETAAAVVENGTKVLANVVSSSLDFHAKTGGIIPEVAAREQVKAIIPVIDEALSTTPPRNSFGHLKGVTKEHLSGERNTPRRWPNGLLRGGEGIDAIAVTVGPGLIGSLLVGVETAKALAFAWKKPLIPVNHLVGHIYANWLETPPQFPLLVLLVSGGHTDLVLMKDHGKFEWLGGTRDDAAGEAFDKTARLLGLGYPGGPEIARLAEIGDPTRFPLPRPMIGSKDYDFSFSGLKTAVLNLTKTYSASWRTTISPDLAASIQEAIVDVLVTKTIRAAQELGINQIALGGGVAANSRLRQKFQLKIVNCKLKIKLYIPLPYLCTDNAAVIASAGYFAQEFTSWQKVIVNPSLHF